MKKGLIYVISAPSGAGKNTVINEFLKQHGRNFVDSVSATTREARTGEKNGKDYFFFKKEKFKEFIKKGKFLEYAKVLDNYYGTPKDAVMKNINKGKNVIMDVDIQGAKKLKSKLKEGCVTVFIIPPSYAELAKRLKGRKTEDKAGLTKRLNLGKKEMKERKKYDYVVINDKVSSAVKYLKQIVDIEKSEK